MNPYICVYGSMPRHIFTPNLKASVWVYSIKTRQLQLSEKIKLYMQQFYSPRLLPSYTVRSSKTISCSIIPFISTTKLISFVK
jgi:hypothetical protein